MRIRGLWVALMACVVLAGSACSGEEPQSEDVPVDSVDVDLVVDLQLASARAEVTGGSRDSLHNSVLATHDVDSIEVVDMLRSYAAHPERAIALYEAASEQLAEERRNR